MLTQSGEHGTRRNCPAGEHRDPHRRKTLLGRGEVRVHELRRCQPIPAPRVPQRLVTRMTTAPPGFGSDQSTLAQPVESHSADAEIQTILEKSRSSSMAILTSVL